MFCRKNTTRSLEAVAVAPTVVKTQEIGEIFAFSISEKEIISRYETVVFYYAK